MVPCMRSLSLPITNIYEVTGDGCCRRHRGADEMRAPAASLATLEVAVAGGGAAFTFAKAISVHRDTHAAPGLTPVKACLAEDIGESFFLSHASHLHRAGHDHSAHAGGHIFPLDILGGHTQIFQA